MNWRDILLGAIVTLIVTVFGSAIAYYLTREPAPPPPSENLIYEIDAPVSFDSGQTKMSFFNLRVKNIGEISATNVTVGVEFDRMVKISDRLVSLSSGPAGNIETRTVRDNQMEVKIAVLTPDESVRIAILTDTADGQDPEIGVKSNASVGRQASLNSAATVSSGEFEIIGIVIVIAIIAQFVVLFLMREKIVHAIGRFAPVSRDVNNTAFVLLHSGLINEAIDMLSKGIRDGGAEPLMLANYGLAIGLNGNENESESVLKAAEFWAGKRSHTQAVIAFNRSLLAFHRGDEAGGLVLIQSAFQKSKKEIWRYIAYSTIVSSLRDESEEFRLFLDEHALSDESG